MVQGASVAVIKEGGERIIWADVDFAPVLNELATRYHNDEQRAVKDFPFLGTIDHWGSTYFNIYQVPLLIAELKRFADEQNKKDELKKIIEETIEFMQKHIGIHRFIEFIGD